MGRLMPAPRLSAIVVNYGGPGADAVATTKAVEVGADAIEEPLPRHRRVAAPRGAVCAAAHGRAG